MVVNKLLKHLPNCRASWRRVHGKFCRRTIKIWLEALTEKIHGTFLLYRSPLLKLAREQENLQWTGRKCSGLDLAADGR